MNYLPNEPFYFTFPCDWFQSYEDLENMLKQQKEKCQ